MSQQAIFLTVPEANISISLKVSSIIQVFFSFLPLQVVNLLRHPRPDVGTTTFPVISSIPV